MKDFSWERTAAFLICVSLASVILYYGGRFIFPILLPFLLGALLAMPLRPLSLSLSRHTRLSVKLCAAVLLVLFVSLGLWGIGALVWRLIEESGRFLETLLGEGKIAEGFVAVLSAIEEKLAHIGLFSHSENLREELYRRLFDMVSGFLTSLSASLPGIVAGIFSALPTVFFTAVISVAAGYYFCIDGERIKTALLGLLPMGWQEWMQNVRGRLGGVFRRYLKAYAELWGLTAGLLLIGFLFLRIEYAFLFSLLIATLDLLPVIGVGTVMLPWSLILLLMRDYYRGFGVLILYLIVELIRQVAEPKLLGKHLGLHPLLTLFATYVGLYCYGFVGMILGPIIALLIKCILPKKGNSPI